MTERVATSGDREYGIAAPAFRLPAETRPGAVRLQVSDLERSLAFYEQVLGMRVLDRSANVASLGGLVDAEPLVELREEPGTSPVRQGGRLGLYHYAILLPDRAALGRFVRHLSEIGARAGASDHLVSEALYLSDPDGLGIEVYSDRPRSEWHHSERQLAMATEPLDLASLAAAGGSEPWRGMPAGTVMGHVHLHVGDIEAAEAFYHAALGFDKVVWSYPGALFLSAGGYHHHLGVNTWARGAEPAGAGDARLLEWEIVLPAGSVDNAVASLERAGHSVTRDAEGAATADPWGTRLRLREG